MQPASLDGAPWPAACAELAFCALVFAVMPVHGQSVPSAAVPEARRAAEPRLATQIRHEGGVAYVSGGGDTASRADALRLGREMNLQLQFVREPDRTPLDDVALSIIDSYGQTVLDLHSSEPLLLAQLEPGRYEVRASVRGLTLQRSVEVPQDGQRAEVFVWSAAAAPVVR